MALAQDLAPSATTDSPVILPNIDPDRQQDNQGFPTPNNLRTMRPGMGPNENQAAGAMNATTAPDADTNITMTNTSTVAPQLNKTSSQHKSSTVTISPLNVLLMTVGMVAIMLM